MVSLMFVVGTILELNVLLILKKKSEEQIGAMEDESESSNRNMNKFQEWIEKVDKICIILFPFLFFAFNVIYINIVYYFIM